MNKAFRFLILAVALLCAGQAWGATYYVNYDTGNDSWDGTSATYTSGTTGPWKTPAKAALNTGVPSSGTHTVEIAYTTHVFTGADLHATNGYLLPNQAAPGTVTWNCNRNWFRTDIDVNTSSYKWVQSSAVGKTDWYYLLTSADGNPGLAQAKSVIVNGYWSAESTNLVNVGFTLYGHYATDNWAWGDYDTLGFSTLYIRYNNGANPTGGSSIWVAQKAQTLNISSGLVNYVFNDANFSGGTTRVVALASPTGFNRCLFQNADFDGIRTGNAAATGSYVRYCRFINSGHRGICLSKQANFEVSNCYFENVHLMVLFDSSNDTDYTLTFKNNIGKKLLAGAIQKDWATPTLTESNNVFHLDPDSTHGGNSIAFTGATPRWTTTAASDLPPSFDATTACNALGDPGCGVDPLTNQYGKLEINSPAIDAGTPVTGLHTSGSKLITGGDAAGNTKLYGNGIDIGAYERKKFLFDDYDIIPRYYTYVAAGAGDTWQSEEMTWQGESVTW